MQSETLSVQKLFQDRRQYRVPFFQRPYVWNEEDRWERLWSDISEKADIRLGGDQPSPHFLGAAVLEPQQRQGLIGVDSFHIIDSQQRFTTLQYFLAALAIVLRQEKQATLLSIVDGCFRNGNRTSSRKNGNSSKESGARSKRRISRSLKFRPNVNSPKPTSDQSGA